VTPTVLFITSPKIDFLQDIIHEGLDELLGPERVICYPYKDYSRFQYNLYPESAQKRPHRMPVGRLRLLETRDSVDAVVVGSIRGQAVETWAELQDEFTHCPVAILHGEERDDPWPDGIRYTHRFKMDLLPEQSEPDLFPLPLAAPARVMLPEDLPRDIDVSFVARSTQGIRRQCAEALSREGFLVLMDADLPREQFCWILNRSKIAVSTSGAAHDTFRYWEIPYHGALLLSQRLPILIPDNFVDGRSAVFFDTPEEMTARIHELLADPDRLAEIAANGRRLSHEKHTAKARARYMLERMGLTVR
jgi:hypothetical protein